MKRTYIYIIAGAIAFMSGGLTSCTSENTTGVETQGESAGIDSEVQDNAEYGEGSTSDYDNVDGISQDSAMDTDDPIDQNADNPTGQDAGRTTTPTTDNGF